MEQCTPLEKVHVLLVLEERDLHHDCLVALAVERPQLAVRESAHGRGAHAVVEDGELAEDDAGAHRADLVALLRHVRLAVCMQQHNSLQYELCARSLLHITDYKQLTIRITVVRAIYV